MSKPKFRQFIDGELTYWGYEVMAGYPNDLVSPKNQYAPSEQWTYALDEDRHKIYEGDIVESSWTKRRIIANMQTPSTGDGWKIIGNVHENPELLK